MSLNQEEVKRTMVSLSKEAKSVVAVSDVWSEILSRLPTKSIFISKCVCKAWRDFASHILAQQRKMPFLPTCGVFFVVRGYADVDVPEVIPDRNKFDSYFIYVSLTTKEISSRIDLGGGSIVNHGYNDKMRGNLSIDLNPLYENPSLLAKQGVFYTCHKGLILTVHIDGTYRVLNPATKQVLELPEPCTNIVSVALMGKDWICYHAIINLSSPLSSTPCSFVVMRFMRAHKLVYIYYPKARKWVQCGYSMEDRHTWAKWYMWTSAFLCESQTLFTLTSAGHCVALQFESLNIEPKICASYCISLPILIVVRNQYIEPRLGESQGCLYLTHVDPEVDVDGLWIWKHCGDVSSPDPWILLFEISKTTRLCKPVAQKHLVKFYDAEHPLCVMGFHPEAAIVFIYVMPSLVFAYDLTNDTLEEIAILDMNERLLGGFGHSYSPCLASLGPFMA